MTKFIYLTSQQTIVKEHLRILSQEIPPHNHTTDYNTNPKFQAFVNRHCKTPGSTTFYIKTESYTYNQHYDLKSNHYDHPKLRFKLDPRTYKHNKQYGTRPRLTKIGTHSSQNKISSVITTGTTLRLKFHTFSPSY